MTDELLERGAIALYLHVAPRSLGAPPADWGALAERSKRRFRGWAGRILAARAPGEPGLRAELAAKAYWSAFRLVDPAGYHIRMGELADQPESVRARVAGEVAVVLAVEEGA